MAYTKLFSSIITSTIWIENDPTRIVWITMLALADKNGEVQGSVPGLARLAGVSVEACDAALATFLAPDERSRTKTDEGRRIEEIDGGWLLLNHAKYRKMASLDDKKEKDAIRQKRARQRHAGITPRHAAVTSQSDIAEAEANTEEEAVEITGIPTVERVRASAPRTRKEATDGKFKLPGDWRPDIECRAYAADRSLDPETTADVFTDYFHNRKGKSERRDADGWVKRWQIWCRTDAERSGPLGASATRATKPSRGNEAFYNELAAISNRSRSSG